MMKHILTTLSKHLTTHKLTLAVAESVTAGYIQFLCSNAPDATQFFQGGITTYNCAQKARHLQVEPIYALQQQGVDPLISRKMSQECCTMFNSHIGLGITGFADPARSREEKIKAYLSVYFNQEYIIEQLLQTPESAFEAVQIDFARQSLQRLNDFFEHQFKA